MRIEVNRFVKVVTFLTSTIAAVLGVWAAVATESHTQYFEGAHDLVLSWSAREIGMAVAGFLALFVLRDARAYVVALGGALVREVLDFLDLFRLETPPERNALYVVLAVSVIAHTVALVMSMKAVRDGETVSGEDRTLSTA